MSKTSWESLLLLVAIVLAATIVITVGNDVRGMLETIHKQKAENCYRRFALSNATGKIYLAEDYCSPKTRDY